jgi:hypothetical protein
MMNSSDNAVMQTSKPGTRYFEMLYAFADDGDFNESKISAGHNPR